MCACTQSLSRVWLFVTLWNIPHQAPLSMGFLSMGFSWKEYWNGLSFPPPGHLPQPSCISFIAGELFIPETLGKPQPANIIGDIVLHCNRSRTNNTQQTQNKSKIFNLTGQYLENYSHTAQHLAYRSWHLVNRQEESPTGGGSGVGAGRAQRLPAIEDEGQAAISLTPDVDGTHVHILESSQRAGLYTGALLYSPREGGDIILRKLILHVQTTLPFLTPWATRAITMEACLGCGDGCGGGHGGAHGAGLWLWPWRLWVQCLLSLVLWRIWIIQFPL